MLHRRHERWTWPAWALVVALGLAACEQGSPATGEFAYSQRLARARRCQISVPDAATQARVRAQLARRPPVDLRVDVSLESEHASLADDDLRVFVGSPSSGGGQLALERLGVRARAGGFEFLGKQYDGSHDGLIATLPDPERDGAPLQIVLCNDVRRATIWIEDWTPSPRPGWRTLRAGAPERSGAIDAAGAALPEGVRDSEAEAQRLFADAARGQRAEFSWSAVASFDERAHAAWFERLDRAALLARARMQVILPDAAELPLELRLFATVSDLARICRRPGLASWSELPSRYELSLVELPGGGDNAGFEVARALTRARAGEPRAAWLLDAVAAASSPDWYGTPSAEWLAHLWTGRLIPEVESLTRDDNELSEHVRGPLRGALLDCCEEQQGQNYAALSWSSAPEQVALPNDTEFRRWLEQRLSSGIERSQAERARRRELALRRAERRGVCLVPSAAHDAEFGTAFGSADCARTLEELREMSANSVAFSWCSALQVSAPREFGRGPSAWTQADEGALFWAMARARGLGLGVVLLPQLLATEHGGWAGQVLMNTQANQAVLFEGWDRFLQHVGLCAQLFDVDVLSIGAEAPDAAYTREAPENQRSWGQLPIQRAHFTRLIDSARRAFGGGLTYVSRWDGETSGIEFWSQLDFLSQNVFARYGNERSGAEPDSAQFGQQLAASFRRLSTLAGEQNVRALVLGVGLSSSALAWREPWRARGELDLEVQKQFYQGLVQAFQVGPEQGAWPVGFYAWCWWTDPAAGGLSDRGFTPQNKPAEIVLRRALRVQ